MMKTAAIHQPNFLPWLGYFYKMYKSDCFVLLDDVQFIRGGLINRVKIKSQNGATWLTVPVQKKGQYRQLINKMSPQADDHWKKKVLGTLQTCYGKSPHFYTYLPIIKDIIQGEHNLIADLNTRLIKWLAAELEISTPLYRSSQFPDVSGKSSERLATICKAVGAQKYLSGFGGQKYQDEEIFESHNIQLIVYDFQHPQYPQQFGEFAPGLSAVDLLFNCGPDSPAILKSLQPGTTGSSQEG